MKQASDKGNRGLFHFNQETMSFVSHSRNITGILAATAIGIILVSSSGCATDSASGSVSKPMSPAPVESFESGTGSKPSAPEEVARLSPEELAQKLESQADFTLVDTRSSAAYDEGHIKGAIWVPLSIIKDGLWKPAPDQELVLY